MHTKHTEPFFFDTAYMPLPVMCDTKLELDENGKIMNLFQPINVDFPDTAWYCNDILCNLNCSYTVPRVLTIIKSLLNSDLIEFPNKIKNIDLCTSQARNPLKLGHTLSCYTGNCSSILLFLDILAPHFPNIREIISFLYKMRYTQKKNRKN